MLVGVSVYPGVPVATWGNVGERVADLLARPILLPAVGLLSRASSAMAVADL